MPELVKREIEASLAGRPAYKGRTREQSAYAIMTSRGLVRGSKITAKGRRAEAKARRHLRGRTAKDAGDALARG